MIEPSTTRQFWNAFVELPADVKAAAQSAYRLFRDNPAHPSLHFKKLEGHDEIYSVRIGLNYRALGAMKTAAASYGSGSEVTPITIGWSNLGA